MKDSNPLLAQLKDIKPLAPIEDHSLLYLIAIIVATLLVMLGVWLWYRSQRPRKRKRALTPKDRARLSLQSIDLNDAKDTSYRLSTALPHLLSGEALQEVKPLLDRLSRYKYAKETPPFSDADRQAVHDLIGRVLK